MNIFGKNRKSPRKRQDDAEEKSTSCNSTPRTIYCMNVFELKQVAKLFLPEGFHIPEITNEDLAKPDIGQENLQNNPSSPNTSKSDPKVTSSCKKQKDSKTKKLIKAVQDHKSPSPQGREDDEESFSLETKGKEQKLSRGKTQEERLKEESKRELESCRLVMDEVFYSESERRPPPQAKRKPKSLLPPDILNSLDLDSFVLYHLDSSQEKQQKRRKRVLNDADLKTVELMKDPVTPLTSEVSQSASPTHKGPDLSFLDEIF